MTETYMTRIGKYTLVQTDEGVRVWRKGKLLATEADEAAARAFIADLGGYKVVSAAKKAGKPSKVGAQG